jgi:hypothetical protein
MQRSRKIEALDPCWQDAARKALAAMNADDQLHRLGAASVIITETRRELSTQMAYYSRGRMSPDHVRAMYDAAEIPQRLTDKETQTAITWTLKSRHILGLAFDAVPLDAQGKCWWNATPIVWMRMVCDCGIVWMGMGRSMEGRTAG